jgi:sec-independent protein translocase protein TatA
MLSSTKGSGISAVRLVCAPERLACSAKGKTWSLVEEMPQRVKTSVSPPAGYFVAEGVWLMLGGQRMFGVGIQELLVIFLIMMVLFGAKRLPEIGRDLGKGIREFKRATEQGADQEDTAPKNVESKR